MGERRRSAISAATRATARSASANGKAFSNSTYAARVLLWTQGRWTNQAIQYAASTTTAATSIRWTPRDPSQLVTKASCRERRLNPGWEPADTQWVHREPDALDHAVAPILPTLCGAAALLSAVSACVDLISLTGQSKAVLAAIAGSVAVVLGVLALAQHRRLLGPNFARPISTVATLCIGAVGGAGIAQTGQGQNAAWIVLALCAAGCFVLGRLWFIATVIVLAAAWPATTWWSMERGAGQDGVMYAQLAVVLIAVVAATVALNQWRLRSLRDLGLARKKAADAEVRDVLTGVANTAGLTMLGGQVLEASRRHGDAVHCLVLDIDGLGAVNDELGRLAGDEVLIGVADSLIAATRAGDVVARWGGDEFVVVGSGTGPSALEVERRVRAGLVEAPPAAPSVWPGRVSAGRAVKEPWDEDTLQSLLERAHREMLLRRALRREAASSPYRPDSVDRSELPPAQRQRPGSTPQAW